MSPHVLVIAEAGSCHDGSLEQAFDLLQAAKDAGADVVKFQFWSSADRMSERRRTSKELRDVYARYQVIPEWLPVLATKCARTGIEFMCSTYLPEDVATVAPFVQRFKVASFEAGDRQMIDAHEDALLHEHSKQVIVSLGMNADPEPWRDAVLAEGQLAFMYCVSAYPAPVEALNIAVLRPAPFRSLRSYGVPDEREIPLGFSDHSDPALTWTGAIAVAAGASIVEAHLKLETTDPDNPDAPHAMTPAQFDDYVRHIRFAEACLGDGVRQLQPCEQEMARYRVGGGDVR